MAIDNITVDLLSAVDFLLRHGRHRVTVETPGMPDIWMFQQDSEVHLALEDAANRAKRALGIDNLEEVLAD